MTTRGVSGEVGVVRCGVAAPLPETALLAGATGLVGGHCLGLLLADERFRPVVAVGRRAIEGREHLEMVVADLARLDELAPRPAAVALCALGTTIRKAGSQAAFRAVDHDAVVAFARWARRGGCATFVLCSSVGADPRSRNFYLRVKGEAEEGVAALGFERFVALRPSLILGARAERRPAEAVAQRLAPVISAALLGPLRRYRSIAADSVAAAMVAAARTREPGRFAWEHDEIAAGAAPPA